MTNILFTTILAMVGIVVLWHLVNYFFNHFLHNVQFSNLTRKDISAIDEMPLKEFTCLLVSLFEARGYLVQLPERKAAGNYFVICKDGMRTAVRFYKFPTRRRITPNAVYHVLSARAFYKCDNTLLITTTRFTAEAETEARRFGVELMDRGKLLKALSEQMVVQKDFLTRFAP